MNTQKSIIKNNILIAKFLFGEADNDVWYSNEDLRKITGSKSHHIHQLLFNKSWDWLMLVILKIKETERFGHRDYLGLLNSTTLGMACYNGIEPTYQQVVNFISWWFSTNQK